MAPVAFRIITLLATIVPGKTLTRIVRVVTYIRSLIVILNDRSGFSGTVLMIWFESKSIGSAKQLAIYRQSMVTVSIPSLG